MTTPRLTNEAIAFTEKKVDMALDDIIKMSKAKTAKPKKQRVSNKNRQLFDGSQNKSLRVRQYMDSRSSVRQGALAQRRTNFQGNRFPVASEAAKNAAVAPMRNRGFNRNKAANWNRPRASTVANQQGNRLAGGFVVRASTAANQQNNGLARGFVVKPRFQQQQQQRQQQQRQQQQQPQQHTVPGTLDSLFASMKEQRMQTFGHQSNGGNLRAGPVQRRQPLGRGQRFRY